MFYLILYLLLTKYEGKNKVLFYLLLLAIYLSLSSVVIVHFNGMNLLYTELKMIINSFYFIVLLLAFLVINKDEKFDKSHLRNILIIYTILTFIPNILNIGFNSYNSNRFGFSGWFYSPNSLGTILLLLFISSYKTLKSFNNIIIGAFCLIYVYSMFTLGTKTPIIGLLLFILVNAIYYLINNKIYRKRVVGVLAAVALFLIVFLPYTGFYKNLKIYNSFLEKENISIKSFDYWDHILFGRRLEFEEIARKEFNSSPLVIKMFGMGYSKAEKTIEMDYFDIFYREGILGFIIYFIPLIYAIIKYVKEIKLNSEGVNNSLLLFLILFLALVQGHVFTSSQVSIFASLLISLNSKDKESIV